MFKCVLTGEMILFFIKYIPGSINFRSHNEVAALVKILMTLEKKEEQGFPHAVSNNGRILETQLPRDK